MKSFVAFVATAFVSTMVLAGDCSSTKMKPTDASAPASTKLAESPKRLQEAAEAEQQAPKQQLAQVVSAVSPSGR
jgi:hypothetical protein